MRKHVSSWLRKILYAIFFILVIAVLIVLITWKPKSQATAYTTATVTQRSIERTLDDTGVITKRTIDDADQQVVQFFVDEDDVDSLSTDQEVDLSIDAIDAEEQGTIYTIADDPTISGDVTEYEVIVDVDEIPEHVRNGMHADVHIVLDSTADDVLAVPNASLYTQDEQYYVNRVVEERRVHLKRLGIDKTDQTIESVEVQIGFEGDDYTEITDGLKEGDVIVAE
ncbi:MAG: hypothetical protein HYV32_01415 [Candidatus Kerfeldbacteria bacterium]|nr:hypothetical protein [Candidatus Kerfeldbacteria bacterium]